MLAGELLIVRKKQSASAVHYSRILSLATC